MVDNLRDLLRKTNLKSNLIIWYIDSNLQQYLFADSFLLECKSIHGPSQHVLIVVDKTKADTEMWQTQLITRDHKMILTLLMSILVNFLIFFQF